MWPGQGYSRYFVVRGIVRVKILVGHSDGVWEKQAAVAVRDHGAHSQITAGGNDQSLISCFRNLRHL